MLKKVVCIFFSIILITSVYADDFDDLFADPEEDIVAEVEVETSVLDKVDETGTVKVTGSFGETLGLSGGLINVLDGFSKNNIKAIFGLDANASVSIEARPHTSFRMYGTLSAKTNEANIADPWNIIDISTLAIEYNIKKTAFFTVGKFATSLGTDFISISDGTSFKISFPTVLSGLNLLVNVDSNTIVNGTVIPQRLYFATWGDAVFGPTRLSLGFRYQGKDDKIHQERFGSYFGLTSSFYGLNFSTELAYYAYPQHSLSGNLLAYYMFNQFYIGMNYTIDAYVTGYDYLNQNIQLGFRYANILDSIFNLDFIASINPNTLSGFVAPVLSCSPLKYLTLSVTVPYIYGDKGFDEVNNVLGDFAGNIETRLSLLTSISIKVDF